MYQATQVQKAFINMIMRWMTFPGVKICQKEKVSPRQWLVLENAQQPGVKGSMRPSLAGTEMAPRSNANQGSSSSGLMSSSVCVASSSSSHKHFHLCSLPFFFPHSVLQKINFVLFQVHAPGFLTFLLHLNSLLNLEYPSVSFFAKFLNITDP